MPKCSFNNHSSAWVFFCKFAAYFQNTFSYGHLRKAASGIWFSKICSTLGELLPPLSANHTFIKFFKKSKAKILEPYSCYSNEVRSYSDDTSHYEMILRNVLRNIYFSLNTSFRFFCLLFTLSELTCLLSLILQKQLLRSHCPCKKQLHLQHHLQFLPVQHLTIDRLFPYLIRYNRRFDIC